MGDDIIQEDDYFVLPKCLKETIHVRGFYFTKTVKTVIYFDRYEAFATMFCLLMDLHKLWILLISKIIIEKYY